MSGKSPVQVEVPIGGKRRRPIDICVPAIARFHDCKVWLARSDLQAHYVFFGLSHHLMTHDDQCVPGRPLHCHR